MNGEVRYWRNAGNGRFDLMRTMEAAPAEVQLNEPGIQLADANGDGRADLLSRPTEMSFLLFLVFLLNAASVGQDKLSTNEEVELCGPLHMNRPIWSADIGVHFR
jgi:hypothetical protein